MSNCIYTTLAPMFLSVVSIAIAVYSARQTSKDATKQINAIRELCRLQIDTSLKHLEIELDKAKLRVKQGKAEHDYLDDAVNGSMGFYGAAREQKMQEFPAYKAQNDYKFYCDYEKQLVSIHDNLENLKKAL